MLYKNISAYNQKSDNMLKLNDNLSGMYKFINIFHPAAARFTSHIHDILYKIRVYDVYSILHIGNIFIIT